MHSEHTPQEITLNQGSGVMISIENKRLALKAISICFMFNLNNQLKCNDLFGCLNRIWNSVDFERTQEVVGSDASDTAKLRKILLLLEGYGC